MVFQHLNFERWIGQIKIVAQLLFHRRYDTGYITGFVFIGNRKLVMGKQILQGSSQAAPASEPHNDLANVNRRHISLR